MTTPPFVAAGPRPGPAAGLACVVPSRHRVTELDGVRGIAILLVLLIHFTDRSASADFANRLYVQIATVGWAGVDLFFVLSGFLITGLLLDAKPSARYFRDFYIRRTLRIFPLYYAVLAVWFVVLPALLPPASTEGQRLLRHFQGEQAWYWTYLSNWQMGLDAAWPPYGASVYWSLAIEEQFYLLWPAVVFLCNRRALAWTCAGVIVTALLARIAMLAGGADPLLVYVSTPTRMDTLAVGALIAVAARREDAWRCAGLVAWIGMPVALAWLAMTWLVAGSFSELHPLMQTGGFTAVALLCGAVVLRAISARPEGLAAAFFNLRVLRFFGKYSYAIYLFHLTVRFQVVPADIGSRLVPGSPIGAQLAGFAAALGPTLVAALLSWHLWEKHFLALRDRLTDETPASAGQGSRATAPFDGEPLHSG